MNEKKFNPEDVRQIALLAKIPISSQEEETLAKEFNATLEVVNMLFRVDVSQAEPTHQVIDLKNVLREDVVQADRMFSQEQALGNAKKTHNGFFMVNQIIEQEDN